MHSKLSNMHVRCHPCPKTHVLVINRLCTSHYGEVILECAQEISIESWSEDGKIEFLCCSSALLKFIRIRCVSKEVLLSTQFWHLNVRNPFSLMIQDCIRSSVLSTDANKVVKYTCQCHSCSKTHVLITYLDR